jgi:MoxR-like ATPase
MIKPVFNSTDALKKVTEMRRLVRDVLVSSSVEDYITNIVLATHPNSKNVDNPKSDGGDAIDCVSRYITYGSSPRGAQAIVLAAKAMALLDNRANISYDDVDKIAVSALNHRVLLNFEAEADNMKSRDIIEKVLEKVRRNR